MDATEQHPFGDQIRSYRRRAGLTQEDLAERAGVAARTISDLERGVASHPQRHTLQLLADALALSGDERTAFIDVARTGRTAVAVPGVPSAGRGERQTPGPMAVENRAPGVVVLPAQGARPERAGPAGRRGAFKLATSRSRPISVARIAMAVGILAIAALALAFFSNRVLHLPGSSAQSTRQGTFVAWSLRHPGSSTPLFCYCPAFRLAVDAQGNIYITSGGGVYSGIPVHHAAIIKLSPSGRFVARFGRYGRRPGEFDGPSGIAVGPQGNIYVADYGNNRIQKLSPTGKVLAIWGSYGTGPGQFDLPVGLTLDARGDVYVADFGNNRIEKFSPTGKLLAVWGKGCGAKADEFCQPSDVAIGPSDDIYVANGSNPSIKVISSTGKPLAAWSRPTPSGTFDYPYTLTVGKQGDLYYVDRYDNFVHKLAPSGRQLATWTVGNSNLNGLALDGRGTLLVLNQSQLFRSTDDGRSVSPVPFRPALVPTRFDQPSRVTVDQGGHVYILTGGSSGRLLKLSSSGSVMRQWDARTFGRTVNYDLTGVAVASTGNVYLTDVFNSQILMLAPNGRLAARIGREGGGPGQLLSPNDVAVDGRGNIYVADTGNNRIQKFSPTGKPLAEWGQGGTAPGQFDTPTAISVDGKGNVYVADAGNHRIQKLSISGEPLAAWNVAEPNRARSPDLTGIAVDRKGEVFVTDTRNSQVIELSPSGRELARWGSESGPPQRFRSPEDVSIDRAGNVFVADTGNDRIARLVHTGR